MSERACADCKPEYGDCLNAGCFMDQQHPKGDEGAAAPGHGRTVELVEKLKWVRKFIEYARYELQPGTQQPFDQFPRQDAADKAMAEIDLVVAGLEASLSANTSEPGKPTEQQMTGRLSAMETRATHEQRKRAYYSLRDWFDSLSRSHPQAGQEEK